MKKDLHPESFWKSENYLSNHGLTRISYGTFITRRNISYYRERIFLYR